MTEKFNPDITQEFKPPKEKSLEEIIERVEKNDLELKRQVEHVLSETFDQKVNVLNFKYLGENKFEFTIEVGGEAKTVIVEDLKPLRS